MGQSQEIATAASVGQADGVASLDADSLTGSAPNTAVGRITGSSAGNFLSPGAPFSGNFLARANANGVVRYFDFDSAGQLAGGFDENWGNAPSNDGLRSPVLDTAVKCSGTSSLRFDIPSQTAANAGGSWWANYSADLGTRFGANTSFYQQIRVRWNAAMAALCLYENDPLGGASVWTSMGNATYVNSTQFTLVGNFVGGGLGQVGARSGVRFRDALNNVIGYAPVRTATYSAGTNLTTVTIWPESQGTMAGVVQVDDGNVQNGIKFFDIVAGDSFVGSTPDGHGITKYYSSSLCKLVVQTYHQHRLPHIYRYYSGANTALFEFKSGDTYLQNQMACTYGGANAVADYASVSGCWTMPADQWVTFQVGVTLGNAGTQDGQDVWLNSTVKLWMAFENQPSTLILDYNPLTAGYKPLVRDAASENCAFGKTFIFPYSSFTDNTQVHGFGQVWYDELIVSTQRIADPYVGPLDSLGYNKVRDLGAFANPAVANGWGANIQDDSGITYDAARRRILCFGGGHGPDYETDIRSFDLATCTWSSIYPSITYPECLATNWDYDLGCWNTVAGLPGKYPGATHTYNSLVVVGSKFYRFCGLSLSRPYNSLFGDTSLWSNPVGGGAAGRVCWYDFNTGLWSFSQWSSSQIPWNKFIGAKYDSASDRIILAGQLSNTAPDNRIHIYSYNPNNDTYTTLYPTSGPSAFVVGGGNDLIYVDKTDTYYIVTVNSKVDYDPSLQQYIANTNNIWSFQLDRTGIEPVLTVGSPVQMTVTGVPHVDFPAYASTVAPDYAKPNSFAYDPINNIIAGGITNGKINVFDLSSNTWTWKQMVHEDTGLNCGYQIIQGAECLDYDVESGCFIFMTNPNYGAPYAAHTFAYRYGP